MGRQNGQSWLYAVVKLCFKVWIILLIGIAANTTVYGASDICKQQQQSSFQLRKLASTSSSKKCADLCCKDEKCHIPLRVKHHCYSVSCAKADLCQIVYEQLKDFEGHRVDKRDVDEEEEDQNWEHDHGQDLSVYQKRDIFSLNSVAANNSLSNASRNELNGNVFAAFLIQETENEITRNAREISSDSSKDIGNASIPKAIFPEKHVEDNRIYIRLNDSHEGPSDETERLLKRSTDDDDDDDADYDNDNNNGHDSTDDDEISHCSHDSKFDHSAIPVRKKNYHFKKLEKKSKTLASCSKKCCKTESCILSFLVEKTCIGIICSGDGDCHTKKDKLPHTKFELSLMKREAGDSSGAGHKNSEEKRSTSTGKQKEDEDEDEDEDVDGGDEDTEVSANKKTSHHKKKSHKKKRIKKHKAKPAEKKDENVEEEDADDDETVDRKKNKKKHNSHKDTHKIAKSHKHKKEHIAEVEGDDSEQKDTKKKSKKKHHIKRKGHKEKSKEEDNNDEESEEEYNEKRPPKKHHVKKKGHKNKVDVDDSGDRKEEQNSNEEEDGSSEEGANEADKDEDRGKEEAISNEAVDGTKKKETGITIEHMDRSNAEDSNDNKKEFEKSSKNENDGKISGVQRNSKKTADEYSDDVQNLVRNQKPRNSTLFDDTVVGDETPGGQDADGHINNDVGQDIEGDELESKEERISDDEPKNKDKGSNLVANNVQEETAGRGDESLKMRKAPYADNDKRNDLMVAHRRYKDVEEVDGTEDRTEKSSKEEEEDNDEENRPRHHKILEHFRDDEENIGSEGDSSDVDEGYDGSTSEQRRGHSNHQRSKSHRVAHRSHYHGSDETGSETDSADRERSEEGHHYVRFHGSQNRKEDEDTEDDGKSDHYITYHGSEKVTSGERDEEEHQSTQQHRKHHNSKVKKSTKSHRKQSPSHSSNSHSKHASSRTKSKKKSNAPANIDKEEKLIDKLEHLEEKLENKQRKVLEVRKSNVLQKVERLTNSLDKVEVKKHKKAKHAKKHEKQPENEVENTSENTKTKNDQSEVFVIPHSSKKPKSHHHHHEKKTEEAASGDGGDSEDTNDNLEKIVISKTIDRHSHLNLEPDEPGSGSGDSDNKEELEKIVIPKTSKQVKSHHSHNHSKHKSEKSKKQKKSKKQRKVKIVEKLIEGSGSGSGSGEDEAGDNKKETTYEQHHHVDQNTWSQRDIVIPYASSRGSHGSHHGHQEMPVLNEKILDSLEKKDTIAKPSEIDEKTYKKSKIKSHDKHHGAKVEKKNKKDQHHKKSHKKTDEKKSKPKGSSKHKSKADIMKEFERYQEFLKAQEIVSSGDGSGGEEISGQKLLQIFDSKKSKSKHQKVSKPKHKHGKEKNSVTKAKKKSHHKHKEEQQEDSSGAEETEDSSGEPDTRKTSKKVKAVHEHKKSNKSNAEKRVGHKNSESPVINSTASITVNATEQPKLPKKTESYKQNESDYSHIRMFHDRKESSRNEDDVANSTMSNQRNRLSNETAKHARPLKEESVPTTKAKQPQISIPNKENNMHSNTTESHRKGAVDTNARTPGGTERNVNETLTTLKQPTSKVNTHNSTLLVLKPTTKADTTTTKPTTAPTTKQSTTPTTIQTTNPRTTQKRSTTTIKTTVKPKKVKFRPTKAVKRVTVKQRHKKGTRKVLTTTYVPTLNIMMGDEDLNTGNIESTTERQQPQTKKYNNKASKKKPKKHQQIKVVAHKETHAKKFQSTPAPRTRTVANPIQDSPYGPMSTNMPTAPAIVKVTANPYRQAKPHQMLGQTSSAGTLGDIQLPEPPGTGNIAAGPPYYKQQGLPSDVPMNGPFDRDGIQSRPLSPLYQPRQGVGAQDSLRGLHNAFDHRPNQPFKNMIVAPTAISYSPFARMIPSQFPLERPTASPFTHGKNEVAGRPDDNPINNNVPQSARKVIERILSKPKPTRPSLITQIGHAAARVKSPLDVIHDILGKPLKNLLHPTSKPHLKATTQKLMPKMVNKRPSVPKKRPTLPHKTPSIKRKQGKSNPVAQNKERKPVNRLNDFFNKVSKLEPAKTTVKPRVLPEVPRNKLHESSAPVSPQKNKDQCQVSETLDNMILVNGRQAGQFTKMPGYPNVPACIKECCKMPTCDLIFKSGEVCYLVHCKDQQSCKTEPSKEPTIHTRILLFHKAQPKKQPVMPVFCEEENAFGISWKATKPGSFASRSCPREAKGMAKRQCKEHAKWFTPDFSGCTSDDYTNLHEETKRLGFTASVKDVITKLEDVTTQTIDNSMIFGGDLVKAVTILDGLSKYVLKNRAERFGFQSLRKFTRSASNLLDETNKQEWENANNSLRGPGKVMRALENFGLISAAKIPPANNMQPIVTNNMVLSVAHLSNIKKYVFPNYSVPILKKWTTKRDTIILPGSLFKSGVVKVASINYKTLAQFLPHQWNTANHVTFTDGFRVNSKVISSAVFPKPKQKINPPVTVILHHLKEVNSARTKCVYWDFTVNVKNGGSWSSDGCWVVTSNSTVTVCQCDHLTHFAVLMNLNDEDRISAKEQAKENTFALMWLGIPILVVLSVGAMYTCFAWSKAPRRRHVVVKDGKPRLPDDEVIITNTVKEDYPGSPNRYLYSSYNSPSPSDLEWEHAWDFLTNSEFENWQDSDSSKKTRSRRKRLEIRPPKLLRDRRKRQKEKVETSEYFSEGSSSSFRWKHQDDNEWSRDRIKCLGKGIIDISSEASQPVDSLEEFSDVTSIADSKDGDKCSNSFDNFSPDAISSPRLGYCAEPKYYSFVYKSDSSLKERESLKIAFNAANEFSSERRALHNSCSSLETLRTLQPMGVQKLKYASTTSLCTIGQRSFARLIERKWNSKISLSSAHSITHSVSSGFLDKTWSSKYASSLSISTLARSVSARTITEDVEYFHSGCASLSEEQGYGTFESSMGLSDEIMDMNISNISDSDSRILTDDVEAVNRNIPTYDTNLLTPSKKPLELISQEDPVEISSSTSSWIDEYCMDEDFVDSWSQIVAKEISEAQEILDIKSTAYKDDEVVGKFLSSLVSQEEAVRVTVDHKSVLDSRKIDSFDVGRSCTLQKFDSLVEASKDVAFIKGSSEDLHDVTQSLEPTCECPKGPSTSTKKKSTKKLAKSSAKQERRPVPVPRTVKIKRKTRISNFSSQKPVKSNVITRSPSKHMRSYIALRQQSRYSDHEKQGVAANEDETKRRKKKILPRSSGQKLRSSQRYVESEDSEYAKDDVEESPAAPATVACATMTTETDLLAGSEKISCDVFAEEIATTVESQTCPNEDIEFDSLGETEDQMRRCVETSVFGVTLKRWKGQSRLYRLRNVDKILHKS